MKFIQIGDNFLINVSKIDTDSHAYISNKRGQHFARE